MRRICGLILRRGSGLFEEVGIFYRGLVLGLMIAAPVGPVGLLCIRRTVKHGIIIGFATGLGAACADTIFGGVAAFSVTVIVEFLQRYSPAIRILGGIFMLVVAWHTWHDKPRELPRGEEGCPPPATEKSIGRVVSATLSSFIITMTNPVTMFATMAVVATFSELQSRMDAITIVSGIFCGSTLWWFLLSGGVALVRGHFTESRVTTINRVTAVALGMLAVWAAVTGVRLFLNT